MSRVAEGHFRRELEAPLISGEACHNSGPSPGPSPAAAYAPPACVASAPGHLIHSKWIIRSSVATRYQLGLARHAGSVTAPPSAPALPGT